MPIMTLRDLRPQLGPARNQGSRPTCIAFAFSDGHAAMRRQPASLSVEHLYYNAVQRTPDGDPDQGVTMPVCVSALAADGQCPEVGWAYLDPIGDLSTWSPPATAAPVFRKRSSLESTSVDRIIEELDADRPVVVALLLGERFYVPDAEGRVISGPNDPDTDYHAVLAVGHGRNGADTYVLVRNSWGLDWGLEGHSWVSAEYLRPRLYALARFPEEETV